ncbi:MAG: hypothetical protein AMJ61_08305 [Desulfobacterales bacterium SG8_35_2]|jgi:hypothetical protein|nr:MAG: hypothetical protein AMJ61_08305 [Desulfobacterales bacterium SG8_35_2]
MKVKNHDAFSWMNRLSILLAAFLAFFLIAGCAGGNYGKIDGDRDLDNMFHNYEVLPDHRYYTSGGYDAPNAILAIHRDYELDNTDNLWVPIPNVDSGQMRQWIDTIAPDQNYRYSGAYFAAYILDPNGKRVGAWFAIENTTTVKFLEGNKVRVYTPQLNQNFYLNRGLGIKGM